MRNLKFRVFDKEFKKMHIVGTDQHDSLNVDFETKRVFYYNYQNGCGSEIKNGDDSTYVLMQYTGLKDKNGKEIYEGDIVRVHEGENFSWEEKVEYFNSCFTVGDDALGAVNTFSEVIGNIYENPELLEGRS